MEIKESAANGKRVLVVDDSQDVRDMLGLLLEHAGHEIRTARDGVEAFETAEEFLPDVIFMDLGMPRMDGYEAASYIRRQDWGAAIRIVAISGWSQLQDREKTRQAGFDRCLVKPVQLVELLAVLDDATTAPSSRP